MRALFLLLLTAMAMLGAGTEGLLRYADPNAGTLIGVEWARIAATPHGAVLQKTFGENWSEMRGLEFIHRLDRLVVSATPNKVGTSLLLVMEGGMDLAELRKNTAALGAHAQRYRKYELLLGPDGCDSFDFLILGANTVALGDRKALVAAVDRLAGGKQLSTSRLDKARVLAGKSDVWSVGSVDVFSPEGLDKLLGKLRAESGDLLARLLVEAIGEAKDGSALELSFTMQPIPKAPAMAVALPAPPPPPKSTIKIYGMEGGTREVDFRD